MAFELSPFQLDLLFFLATVLYVPVLFGAAGMVFAAVVDMVFTAVFANRRK